MSRAYFLVVCLVLCVFTSCTRSDNSGFKILVECSSPEIETFLFNEEDIIQIDWMNQIYQLKENKIDKNLFKIKTCFGSCRLSVLLHGRKLYDPVLYCDVAPNHLPLKGNNVIYLKASDEKLNLLYDNSLQLSFIKWYEQASIFETEEFCWYVDNEEVKNYLRKKGLLE